ncbi:MAG: hypothetical protein CVU48_10090 [Candidatus Cloacimonetes bacterium HGW-Cloacimonetes-1]|nr:MAG: hypothetical protein CVU48_10090 [Candidatus Cloacimonetes bacterium HGW-Cloacimonetes-1]
MKRTLYVCVFVFWSILCFAETIVIGSGSNGLGIISNSKNEIHLQYNFSTIESQKVSINGNDYHSVNLLNEGITQEKGKPQLPVFNRSVLIPETAKMKLQVYDLQYQDIQMKIVPSKGIVTRDQNIANIPYTFDAMYKENMFYPSQIATLSDPYILRDYRGITIQTNPCSYNPVAGTFRVYTSFKIRIYADGTDNINTMSPHRGAISRSFLPIYENHFVNFSTDRYTSVSDSYGKLLVICPNSYISNITPFINWKKQKGIDTELVNLNAVGTTAASIQTYIQNRYNADNQITFVQLIGDAAQLPTLSSGGGGSDPTFALVAGSDSYPDIFIGRFSAETTAHLDTQINRTIYYEKNLTTSDTWLSKAIGIASSEGGATQGDNGESDIIHMNLIRTNLMSYGYSTVDQIYDPGATAAQVTTAVNSGIGLINYVGHGSDTAWSTTGFSNTQATALSNQNKTPFIVDVACVNGNFVSLTCFAEAWTRATNGGAIAMYASTINQSWNSPMHAQDEINRLMTNELKTTAGGLLYNGACKMIDTYTTDGINMYKTWHIFGDASLLVRTKTPMAMTVSHPAQIFIGATSVAVSTGVPNALVSLTYNNTIYGKGVTNSSGNATITLSNPPASSVTYTVTATAFNRVTYLGSISQIPGSGAYMGVTATTYSDTNNNVAEYNETGRFSVTFNNIGAVAASNVTATLTCATSGITITDNSETITSLAAGASVTKPNAYTFNTANNIANGTSAAFTITMVSGTDTWTHNFSQVINAPSLSLGSMTILDPSGNNNGRIDPGESFTVRILLSNTGAAASVAGSASLTSPTTGITITDGSETFTALAASGSTNISFTATAAASMTVGTSASFVFGATAGAYTAAKTETSIVGLLQEDFETGNFSSFPWTFGGNQNWTIVNTGPYAGTYAAKSGTIIDSQSTTMQTTRILTTGGTLSFYYKVSSESAYDFLKFYIDDALQGSGWSGEVAWTQATYTLGAGTRTLRWEYTKDSSVSSGSDCAWIDNITFPASTNPIPNNDAIVVIGTGTSTQTYPMDRYYNYSTHEAIYLASEIGTAGNITKLGYYKSSGTDTNAITNVTIYLKHITTTTMATGSYSTTGYTQVYAGSYPNSATTGWMEVTLAAPFAYNGTSTLSLLLVKGNQSYILSGYPNWAYSSGTNRSRQARDDDSQPTSLTATASIPNIRFTKQTIEPNAPMISVNPTSITESLYVGASTTKTITVTNSGTAALTWQIAARNEQDTPTKDSGGALRNDQRPFWISYSATSGTIPAGQNVTITATLSSAGLAIGTQNSSIVINSNSSNAATVTIPISFTVQAIPYPTSPRFIAEFEPMNAALIRYPLGIPYSMVRELAADNLLYTIVANTSTQTTAISNYTANSVNLSNCRWIIAPSDTYWARDYGPWYVFDNTGQMGIVDFAYNRPRPTDDAIPTYVASALSIPAYQLAISHTGGNIMTDGNGIAASTRLVLEENTSLSTSQINTMMNNYLGITDYQLYEDPNNTYIDHIDCWAKYLDVDKIIIRSVPTSHAQYSAIEAVVSEFRTKTSSWGTPYKIYRVYTPNNEPYSNAYILNKKIFVPQMGTANDAAALQAYRSAMPGYSVIGFTAGTNAWESTDAIHCRVNSVPDAGMIFMRHTKVNNLGSNHTINVSAQIDYHNSLVSDSTYVSWKHGANRPWQRTSLVHGSQNNWSISIPTPEYGDTLFYMINAYDTTGRKTTLPLCGQADPFVSVVQQVVNMTSPIPMITKTSSTVNLSWQRVPGATSYRIMASATADGVYTEISSTTNTYWSMPIISAPERKFFKIVASTRIAK